MTHAAPHAAARGRMGAPVRFARKQGLVPLFRVAPDEILRLPAPRHRGNAG